jgi:hypothetical protein
MVAAMCEEVQNPEREVPKAMVLSVVAAAITVSNDGDSNATAFSHVSYYRE